MKIAITDANIFIDLIHIGLHDKLFALDVEVHTTHEVFDELNTKQKGVLREFVDTHQLTLHKGDEAPVIGPIQARKGLSETDRSVLYLAVHLGASILTGDGLLRKVSEVQKIEVHGIFWLLECFISKKLINKTRACKELGKLQQYNKRLPQDECVKRLAEWGK